MEKALSEGGLYSSHGLPVRGAEVGAKGEAYLEKRYSARMYEKAPVTSG